MEKKTPRPSRYEGPDLATRAAGIPDQEKNRITEQSQNVEEQPFDPGVYDERSYHPREHRSKV